MLVWKVEFDVYVNLLLHKIVVMSVICPQTSVQYFCGESCVITEASVLYIYIIIECRQRNQHCNVTLIFTRIYNKILQPANFSWSLYIYIYISNMPLVFSTIELGLFSAESWTDFLKNQISVESAFGFAFCEDLSFYHMKTIYR